MLARCVLAPQDWQLVSVSLTSWRPSLVVPRRTKIADKVLDACLLATSAVSYAVVEQ